MIVSNIRVLEMESRLEPDFNYVVFNNDLGDGNSNSHQRLFD